MTLNNFREDSVLDIWDIQLAKYGSKIISMRNDFIEKMIEIAKTGYENMTQLQCVFFTWNEFFNTEEDACRAFEVASQIFSAAYPDEAPLDETNDFWGELACYL